MTDKAGRKRVRASGRYTYGNGRLCVCGHTLGEHLEAAPNACIVWELRKGSRPCSCDKFRPALKLDIV